MSKGYAELVEGMRLATSMNSPAGMAALLTEGAAAIEELLSKEQMTLEDLFAQAALDRCLKVTFKHAEEVDRVSLGAGSFDAVTEAVDMAYEIAEAMIARRKQ